MSLHIYLNLFSVKKLRNSLRPEHVPERYLSLGYMRIFLHLISLHFYFISLDQLISVLEFRSADFCPWVVWLIFKILLENHLDGKELMREWEGTTFPVTMELCLLNYHVGIHSSRKLVYLPFILKKPSSYENFISEASLENYSISYEVFSGMD